MMTVNHFISFAPREVTEALLKAENQIKLHLSVYGWKRSL